MEGGVRPLCHPRPSGPPGPRGLDEEARTMVSWSVVSWVRQAVILVGLVVLAFRELEVALLDGGQ